MNKTLMIALMAMPLAGAPAMAADSSGAGMKTDEGMKSGESMKSEGSMRPTAGDAEGAPSNQTPGTETSDRTPGKATPTPQTQVDKSSSGATSDRTPRN